MRILIFTFLMLLVSCQNDPIDRIKERRFKIEDKLDEFQIKKFEDVNFYNENNNENYSKEAEYLNDIVLINMDIYYENEELVKIQTIFSGSFQDLVFQCYIENDNVIFINTEMKEFFKLKYAKDFDSTKYTSTVNQYYFQDNKLILWNNNNSLLRDRSEYFCIREQVVLHDFLVFKNHPPVNRSEAD